jgi:hypothetical protein
MDVTYCGMVKSLLIMHGKATDEPYYGEPGVTPNIVMSKDEVIP